MFKLLLSSTLCSLIMVFISTNSFAASFKCWTNSDGVRECGNSIPPQYIKQRIQYHNAKSGTVNKVKVASKTDAQIRREKEQNKKQELARKKVDKQNAYDDVLLKTYLSVDDLLLSLDWKITTLDSQIKVTNGSIDNQNKLFVGYSKQAAISERGQGQIPENITKQLNLTRNKIKQLKQRIVTLNNDKKSIRLKFKHDIERFTVAKISGLNSTLRDKEKSSMIYMAQLRCYAIHMCDKYWKRAKQFVDTKTNLANVLDTETIYATVSPIKSSDYALTVSKVTPYNRNETVVTLKVRCHPSREGEANCANQRTQQFLNNFYGLVK